MNDDRIQIDFEGEDEPEPAPSNRLIITNDDLKHMPDVPSGIQMPGYRPAAPNLPAQFQKKGGAAQVVRSGIGQAILAGFIGGFIAWAVTEAFFGEDRIVRDAAAIILEMGVFGALIGGIIGSCLGAAEGIVSQVYEKALRAGAIGLGIGAAGGFLGGVFGQIVYGALLQSGEPSLSTVMVARVLGWTIVGVLVGLGQGIGRGSGKRIINGLIGGAAGGFAAGFLFDPIGLAVGGGVLSRAVGITILGTASGAAIGLVEQVRKQAWISVIDGPLAGKEFILYETQTRIGSSPKCEITLPKDPGIAPEHAVIENQGSSHLLSLGQSQAAIMVDGRPTQRCQLQSGNVITLGSTSLLFEEKAVQPMGQV